MSLQPGVAEQLRSLPENSERDDAELEVALLINRILQPDVDVSVVRARVDKLIALCDHPSEPWVYLRELGFSGNGAYAAMLENSRLDAVLDGRCGIPISLGVLLIHVARCLGHKARGVNFPGHFLVRIEQRLIDPFDMVLTSEDDFRSRLSDASASAELASEDLFAVASARSVALRMLNNIKFHQASISRWDLALDMLDYQLTLQPDDPGMIFERGQFWLRLGAIEAARQSFIQCRDLPDVPGELASLATQQLRSLDSHGDTLH